MSPTPRQTPLTPRAARPRAHAAARTLLCAALLLLAPHAPTPVRAQGRPATRPNTRPASPPAVQSAAPSATPPAAKDAPAKTAGATAEGQRAKSPEAAPERARKDARREAAAVTGSITGRVVGDDGQPLTNAVVRAVRPGISFSQPVAVSTGEDGRFRFDSLEAGVYRLPVNAPGYAPEMTTQAEPPVYYRLGESVTLRMVKGGVITGAVTDAEGDAVVTVPVRAVLVRGLDGTPARDLRGATPFREQLTDDRGVYRIYGLQPGVYVVSTGGSSPGGLWQPASGYDNDAPTYAPSSTRDGAAEITVRAGDEAGGVDIRYRGGRGHAVSGTVTGLAPQDEERGGVNVSLRNVGLDMINNFVWVSGREGENSFTFAGLADGEYELQAQFMARGVGELRAPTRRVTVKGGDVTGLQLALAPLASVSGNVRLEALAEAARAKASCAEPRLLPQEVVVTLRRDEGKDATARTPRTRDYVRPEAAPDAGGDFALRGLEEGRYRVEVRPFDEEWYLSAVEARAPAATAARTGASRTAPPTAPAAASSLEALDLKPGQQFSALRITLAQGAAALAGRLAPAEEPGTGGARPPLPTGAPLHLVPAERERADDALRFREATLQADGTFAFSNLAPGRYWLLSRPAVAADGVTPAAPPRPAAWDADARARLRRDAEAAGIVVELRPCQRVEDFTLRR